MITTLDNAPKIIRDGDLIVVVPARRWVVMQGIAQGLSNQEIADQMTVSLKAVEHQINRIFCEFGLLKSMRNPNRVKIARLVWDYEQSQLNGERLNAS